MSRPLRTACVLAVSLAVTSGPAHAAAPAPAPASRPAAPASDSRLAVLPIALSGSEDEAAGASLFDHLNKGLARGAFTVVPPADVEKHAAGGCSEPRCLEALRTQAGATFALRSVVTVDDRDYVVRLELLATRDGAVLASSEERCDLCGLAEVGALVEAQGALLRRSLEDLIQGPPRLVLTSKPAGALVFVDDKLVGTTPFEQNLLEGTHVIRLTLANHVTAEQRVELVAGVRETLDVQLRPEPKIARFRATGWAGLLVGLPVAAAGVSLLALDGRQFRGRCGPGDVDANSNCRYVFDTDWGGAFALAAGAALVTAGVMLLLRTRDRSQARGPARGRPRALLGPTGVTIVGRF